MFKDRDPKCLRNIAIGDEIRVYFHEPENKDNNKVLVGDIRFHTKVELPGALCTLWLASVAQLDAPSDWRPGGRGFNPR